MNAPYNAHSTQLFEHLKLLTLPNIYKYEIGKFMYKYVNGFLPEALQDLFIETQDIHLHFTRQNRHLRPKITRLKSSQNSLLFKGPTIWNALPTNMKEQSNVNSFNYKLMNYFLNQ
jgi:hypothetical protein